MTTAQKNNAVKFKKAIAIRKKTGCSLKEAFAQVYGKKKVGSVKKKTLKKSAPKRKVKIVKKKAIKKAVTKKKVAKKSVANHKDTKSHNVNIKVMSGVGSIHKDLRTDAEKALVTFNERLERYKKELSQCGANRSARIGLKKLIAATRASIAILKVQIREHNKQILK